MSAFPDPGRTSERPGAGDEPPARPDSVSIAVELWLLVIVAQTVAFGAEYPTTRQLVEDRMNDLQRRDPNVSASDLMSSGIFPTVFVISALVLIALSLTVVWFTRRGHNWSRYLLGAMGIYVLISMVFGIVGEVHPGWAMIPIVISGVAGLGASVLLMRRDADDYCRAMAAHRRPRPVNPPAHGPPGSYYRHQGGDWYGYPPVGGHDPRNQYPPTQQYPPHQQYPPNPYPYPQSPYPPTPAQPSTSPPSQNPPAEGDRSSDPVQQPPAANPQPETPAGQHPATSTPERAARAPDDESGSRDQT